MKVKITASVDIDALKTETGTSCESVDEILDAICNECHWLDDSGIHVDTVEMVEASEKVTIDKEGGKYEKRG